MGRETAGARRSGAASRSLSAKSATGSDQVQSLVRALSLLNRVAEVQGEGATLTELAQQVGLRPRPHTVCSPLWSRSAMRASTMRGGRVLSHQLGSGEAMFGRPAVPHATVAVRHVRNASSRKAERAAGCEMALDVE